MKEFFIGLLVILALLILSAVAALFMPFILLLGVFLQGIIYLAFVVFGIWLIGRITLWAIDYSKDKRIERDAKVTLIEKDRRE